VGGRGACLRRRAGGLGGGRVQSEVQRQSKRTELTDLVLQPRRGRDHALLLAVFLQVLEPCTPSSGHRPQRALRLHEPAVGGRRARGVRVRAWAGRAWEEVRRRTFRRGTTLHQLQRERQREHVH
jgi:hypothetical protein